MKKYLLISILLVLVIPFEVIAEEKTLVGNGFDNGGYGAPVVKFMSLGGEVGVLVGGRGGWIINHTFVIGGGGGKVSYTDAGISDKFFYVEPTFNGEVNIMNWFRINAGIGYLWVDNIQNMPGLSSSDVRGITGTVVFKLGSF
jgi:hypothetical protein